MSQTRQSDIVTPENIFLRNHYLKFIKFLFIAIAIMLGCATFAMYQVTHRPLPPFYAVSTSGNRMILMPYDEPNHLPPTIVRWSSRAAVAAYTFDFANYEAELATARTYFTQAGWASYQKAVSGVIQTIIDGKLIVNGVVSGAPVISSEGPDASGIYSWTVQIPFSVVTQTSEKASTKDYLVILTIVKVPTQENKEGVGIEQFIMTTP